MEQKVHLKANDNYYRFLSIIPHINDGSIIICIKTSQNVRINYHATGQVNYHGFNEGEKFHLPLSELTSPIELVSIEVPSIEVFDHIKPEKLQDFERESSFNIGFKKNIKVGVFIRPTNILGALNENFLFTIGNIYSVAVVIGESATLFKDLNFKVPKSTFTTMQMPIDEAIVRFHQKSTGKKTLIIYPPNGESVVKIFPAVPMRIVPRVKLEFGTPEYTYSVIEEQSKNYRVAIKMRGKGGRKLDQLPPIKMIELDAEL